MDLILRRIRRHWPMSLAVLLCLILASTILASLSLHGAAVAARELGRSLEAADPAERSLLITGTPYTFGQALYADLQGRLGRFLEDRLVIRHATLPADPQPSTGVEGGRQAIDVLDVYSFDTLALNVRLVEGRLPDQARMTEAVGNWPPAMEVVIGLQAAAESGYGVGDRLTANDLYHRMDIVGVVEPLAPHDDLWGGDLSAFAIQPGTGDPDGGEARDHQGREMALPLILESRSMQSYLGGPILPHEVAWRITLDPRRLGVGEARALYGDLVNFQTQSATRGARTDTGLLQILSGSLARLSRVRTIHLWLAAQTLMVVLVILAALASCMVDRAQVELVIQSGRGASAWQAIRGLALETLILALLAGLLLGPALALVVNFSWTRGTGQALPLVLPGEAWLLSAVAAGLGWLVLVLPVYLAGRRCERVVQPQRQLPWPLPQQLPAHRRYLDLYLLAFGGLLYWQLNRSGSFVMRQLADGQLADPLLLIGPSLLLFGLALFLLRFLPLLLRPVARLARSLRGLVLPLGLLRLARDPLGPGRLVLAIGLAAGLVLFAAVFGGSLALDQAGALAREIASVFQLNSVLLVLFNVLALILVLFLAAREHGVWNLRVTGVSPRQWQALWFLEGIVVLLLGLVTGVLLGLGLAWMMLPHFAGLLPGLGPEAGAFRAGWPAAARACLLLVAAYGTALALLWPILSQARPDRTRRVEEE